MKALTAAAVLFVLLMSMPPAAAQSDLDAFMQRVMTRRDDNWKKLQQYILDEREVIELRGPDRAVMWGDRREFTWYMRDDRFVRSPLRFNGVEIGDADRRKYEADFVRREQEREKRRAENPSEFDGDPDEPQFVSSAYFLRFKFESGKCALVGRERSRAARSSGSSITRRSCSTRPGRGVTGRSAATSAAGLKNRPSRCSERCSACSTRPRS
jgi:hypothetical protein